MNDNNNNDEGRNTYSDVTIACHMYNFDDGTSTGDYDLFLFLPALIWNDNKNRQKLKTCTGLSNHKWWSHIFHDVKWMMMSSRWNWFREDCDLIFVDMYCIQWMKK